MKIEKKYIKIMGNCIQFLTLAMQSHQISLLLSYSGTGRNFEPLYLHELILSNFIH